MFILRRRRKVEVATETASLPRLLWRRVSHLELLRATNGFDESNLIGTGGFGSVYKGTISDEIFTKRKPTDEMFVGEMNLKKWIANSLFPYAAIVEVVDGDLLGTEEDHDIVSRRDCLSSIMRLGLARSAESPEERINMQDVVVTLNKIKIKFLKDCGGVLE
ncbi:unnamed protein product [Prunus brigantina]